MDRRNFFQSLFALPAVKAIKPPIRKDNKSPKLLKNPPMIISTSNLPNSYSYVYLDVSIIEKT